MERRHRPVVEVTPAMISAGATALQAWQNGNDYYDVGAVEVLKAVLGDGFDVVLLQPVHHASDLTDAAQR